MKQNNIRVYIACPYSLGDTAMNVKNAMDAFEELLDLGFTPFNPLLSHFQHMLHPRPYKDWLEYDLQWLPVCHCVLRLPGESKGAEIEERKAKEYGIMVFHSIESLRKFYETRREV